MYKPTIGIVADHEVRGGFSNRPYYAMRQDYADAISDTRRAVPVMLTYHNPKDYIGRIDGFLSIGGQFASPQNWYLEKSGSKYSRSIRANKEIKFFGIMRKAGIPGTAICAGEQIFCGANNSIMTNDVDVYKTTEHYKEQIQKLDLTVDFNEKVIHTGIPATQPAHLIDIVKDTLLYDVIGQDNIWVNSHHQEMPIIIGSELRVSARSRDGLPEAVEYIEPEVFFIAVQWHPEISLGPDDPSKKIFRALAEHSSIYHFNHS
ncbi:MAG: gamma-glutamyl-gamma-aminobutyrate hydrolase family protein [Alphaproteobacteria bacterium]